MTKTKPMTPLKAIKTYQVPGDIGDFNSKEYCVQEGGCGWADHHPATYVSNIGKIYLGMPKGFNRLGNINDMVLMIFENYDQYIKFYTLPYNVPCWKYLDEYGNTLIRGLMPRVNRPYICVVLGNIIEKINCIEITIKDIEEMD